jgi:hypothetical protein
MANSGQIFVATHDSGDECFFRAPLGSPLPTSATDTLSVAFVGHGWADEDGITNSIKRNVTRHKAFGGDVVRVTLDDYQETLKISFLETTDPDVLRTVFGNSNVVTDLLSGHRKTTVRHKDQLPPRSSFVVRTIDGTTTRMLVIPEGQVTEVDDVKLDHKELTMYTVTIDCYKPATGTQPGNPDAVNEYIDEPSVSAGS